MRISLQIGLLCLAAAISLPAQDGFRGHWAGSVEIPGHPMRMEVDLDKAAGGWAGSISIPEQNASGVPLEAITFAAGKCTFKIKGVPGSPAFTATLSTDGKAMSGEFTQGFTSAPFKFTRSGDPKVTAEKPSPAVGKEFLGVWEGTLEVGQPLRLILTLANGDNGATASLVSVDQGGAEIPVSAIEQKGTRLILTVKMIGGKFDSAINKDNTELSGTWTQGDNSFPLKLAKKSETRKP